MNKKAYELYPYILDKWMLFQQPEGGYLRHHEGDETYLTGEIWDLTDLAVKIVLLCDGTNNVKDIIKNIHETCEATGFTPSLSAAKFLADAKQNDILDFQDEPKKHLLTLKGSKERAYPMHFAIELTDACNLKCRHCYRESGPALSNRLPTEKLIGLLKEMQTNGVHSLELSGGEPTFHPDFLHILEFSLDHFGAVALLTNGTLLNDKIYNLLEKHKNKAIVQIDLDGCNAEEHEYIRGQTGCFDKAVKALKEMSERGIRVRVAMSIHSGNLNSIEKTYQLAKINGAKWFSCSPILDIGRANDGMLLTWEQLKASMKLINQLNEKDPETVLTASELKRLSGKLGTNCGAGSRSVALGPDGKIRPCFLVNTLIPSFKNVLEMPLEEVIKQAPLSFYRNLEPPCPDLCGECKYTVFCYGCVARPLIAWDRMKQENKDFQCSWNTATGFRERIGLDA